MTIPWYWKGAIVGIIVEASALLFVILGEGNFKESLDSIGIVGAWLHAPGWLAIMTLKTTGFVNYLLLVGVPLVCWIAIADVGFWLIRGREENKK